ncbi:hypothetical protein EVAR_19609_1 [Eumeta japonica]|uniref:Uncharacterized protein n=1 Tax=Eumeta variegata TaxID=151549 RepID=A0A4C1UFF2_EUMVA|nr:hypothetical protein EVAR_19609_1 [Eumeta japonica]
MTTRTPPRRYHCLCFRLVFSVAMTTRTPPSSLSLPMFSCRDDDTHSTLVVIIAYIFSTLRSPNLSHSSTNLTAICNGLSRTPRPRRYTIIKRVRGEGGHTKDIEVLQSSNCALGNCKKCCATTLNYNLSDCTLKLGRGGRLIPRKMILLGGSPKSWGRRLAPPNLVHEGGPTLPLAPAPRAALAAHPPASSGLVGPSSESTGYFLILQFYIKLRRRKEAIVLNHCGDPPAGAADGARR